jgi:hypothetical protein
MLETINVTESMLEAVLPYGLPVKVRCFALNRKAKNKELEGSLHIYESIERHRCYGKCYA